MDADAAVLDAPEALDLEEALTERSLAPAPALDMSEQPIARARCAQGEACEPLEHVTLGLMNIGKIELAIPTDYLREAIDYPGDIKPLLTSSPHVAGAVDVRGDLIPVIDLRHALNLPPSSDARRRIVLATHRHYLFGIVVDSLGGVITVPASNCQTVEVAKPREAPLIRQVLALDQGERVVSMLCLDGVINQIDVPLTKSRDRTADHIATQRAAQTWSPYVLFECGETRLAIHADHVDTVIDWQVEARSSRHGEHCLGIIQSDARRLAVLDGLRILGLGQTHPDGNRQVLVLKHGANSVGIMIRQVSRIERLDDGTRRAIPPMSLANPDLFDGVLPLSDGSDHLLIDAEAFLGTDELTAMASIHGRPLGGSSAQIENLGSANARTGVYLTFSAGRETACLLKDVREILPLPARYTPIERPGDWRIGLFTHRERVLPIIDLAPHLGMPVTSTGSEARLLLVETIHGEVALLVESVHAIERAEWTHPPIAQSQWRGADPLQASLNAQSLLTIGEGASKRGVPALDLPRVALALVAHYGARAG